MKLKYLVAIALMMAQTLDAGIVVVTNTKDSGTGSFRWAVSISKWKDTVIFSNITDKKPITLTSGFVLLNKSISIIGNGMGNTLLDGNSSTNIFYCDEGTNMDTIRIQKLTIQNGNGRKKYEGGGYNNIGGRSDYWFIVDFLQVEVKDCEGFNGGGIKMGLGSLTDCYIHDNFGELAGGLYAPGNPVSVTNTTFSNNIAFLYGAAYFIGPSNLKNCSIFGNKGIGIGIKEGRGALYLTGELVNCTITNNTGSLVGGLAHNGRSSVKMYNNIIYGNKGGSDVVITADPFFDQFITGDTAKDTASYDRNIVGSCTVTGPMTSNCPTWFSTADPGFNPAGPQPNSLGIPVLGLVCRSIAIDKANAGYAPSKDQNGMSRYSLPDLGAVESGDAIPVATVTASDTQLISDAVGASYQWLDCNNSYAIIPAATSKSFKPTLNGSYAVRVSNMGGVCSDTSNCFVISALGISNFQLNPKKELMKIMDVVGRETEYKPNTVLIYLYKDGSTERIMRIEE